MKKTTRIAAVGAAAALTLAGCASTEANEVSLHYDRGPLEGRGFNQILGPNTANKLTGPLDKEYTYRIDQRSWIGRSNDDGSIAAGADRGAVEFVSKDGLRMRAPFELYFTLNQDSDTLREFHEEIGMKTEAWTQEGWVLALRQYLDPQLERAIDTAGLAHEWRPLREDESVRQEFAQAAEGRFAKNLADVIGGNYFCGPTYQDPGDECGEVHFAIGQPAPVDTNVVKAIEAEQTANAQTQSLAAEARRAAAEAEARQVLIDQVGPVVFACLEAIQVAREVGVAPPMCLTAGNEVAPVVPVG